ncbi:NYN domain-containing protein [Anaerotalea alkaliphila]|uniref:NYN domain-containing protein n=1 Tax=Anaerotalea alkaliphila TaxID=2662126 RepID=A0A7X5KMU8_9FIRM|nr:NYN domain-containing protein [Anaerotalea alkaliphila]NDL68209.1 NYN domain-containing protein [Anaerotalea alkaliphila]
MAAEYLLVDGYNIIFAWEQTKEMAEESLDNARQTLMEELSNFQGITKARIILIFDAHLVKGNVGKVMDYKNIKVVFTKERETADHFIEKVAYSKGRDVKIRVATSDGLEQTIILGSGASRMTAKELREEIDREKQRIREEYTEKIQLNNNRLEGHLDPQVREWMETLRRLK